MANVQVSEPHNCTAEEAVTKIGEFEAMMTKYGIKSTWNGTSAKLKGTGVSGTIAVDASHCNINLKLGMLARAAGVDATRLEGSIRKRLQAAFGTAEEA